MSLSLAICVNHLWPSIGGCEYVIQALSTYLAKFHDVYVVTRRISGRNPADFEPVNVIEYSYGNSQEFHRKILQIKPDVLFIYSDMFDFFRLILTSNYNCRIILAPCGSNWVHKNRAVSNVFFRNVHQFQYLICHSTHERDYKICSSKQLADQLVVIPNGIDTTDFDSNYLTRKDLIEQNKLDHQLLNKKWVLNVSNFFPGKGQTHLLKILKRISTENVAYFQLANDAQFTQIADTLEVEWYRQSRDFRKETGIPVVLLKNLSREQVIGMFKQSNLFAFTSEKEVAPIVMLECLAAALTWVSATVGNVKDLKGGRAIQMAKDTRFYTVFNDHAYDQFAQTIDTLLSQPKLGEDGRYQVDTELNWSFILPQYKSLIES